MANNNATASDDTQAKERWDAVSPYEYEHNGETRTDWIEVGRAFPNSTGSFTIRLRAVPVPQDGEVVIVIKKREAKKAAAE